MTGPAIGWLLPLCAPLVILTALWRAPLARVVALWAPPLVILAWAITEAPGLAPLTAAALVWADRARKGTVAWWEETRSAALYALCLLGVGADPRFVWLALLALCVANDGPWSGKDSTVVGRAARGAGLGLVLFGMAAGSSDPELAAACQAIGLGTLIVTLPWLTPVLFMLLHRPDDAVWVETLWLLGWFGLALVLVLAISRNGSAERAARLGAIALSAIVLGLDGGAAAAWILLSGVAVSLIARRAIPATHPAARFNTLGLAGIPPAGATVGLLTLFGVLAAYSVYAVVIAAMVWAAIAWPVLRQAVAHQSDRHDPWTWLWLAIAVALPAGLAGFAP